MASTEEIPKEARCKLANCPAYGKGIKACEKCTGPVQWKDERGNTHGKTRSCHNCPNGGLGLPVCWAACPGPSNNFQTDGQSMVTLGALENDEAFIAQERADKHDLTDMGDSVIDAIQDEPDDHRRAVDSAITARLSAESESACRIIFATIMGMDETDLRIFYHLYRNTSPAYIAPKFGISKQAVCKRIQRMSAHNPWMRYFVRALNLKHSAGGGSNRGKLGDGSLRQDDLFSVSVMEGLKSSGRG